MEKKSNKTPESPIAGVTWLLPECCKDCMFRFKDHFTIDGKTYECTEDEGYKKSSCEIFRYPDTKPYEVIYNTGKCEYYEKEKRRK